MKKIDVIVFFSISWPFRCFFQVKFAIISFVLHHLRTPILRRGKFSIASRTTMCLFRFRCVHVYVCTRAVRHTYRIRDILWNRWATHDTHSHDMCRILSALQLRNVNYLILILRSVFLSQNIFCDFLPPNHRIWINEMFFFLLFTLNIFSIEPTFAHHSSVFERIESIICVKLLSITIYDLLSQ